MPQPFLMTATTEKKKKTLSYPLGFGLLLFGPSCTLPILFFFLPGQTYSHSIAICINYLIFTINFRTFLKYSINIFLYFCII